MSGRIVEKYVEIDEDAVKKFFDARSTMQFPYLYNYTNYQDKNPELVLERDACEKKKIMPLLNIKRGMRVLDIGCGVGRWAESVLSCEATYVGIDSSDALLNIARRACFKIFGNSDQYDFLCIDFQKLYQRLPRKYVMEGFDVIIINGVMMYINDKDLGRCLSDVNQLLNIGGLFYVKESIASEKRLTLDKVYSEELSSHYSAIYRRIHEYEKLWENMGTQYHCEKKGYMYGSDLKNRKETDAYYWILRKTKKV